MNIGTKADIERHNEAAHKEYLKECEKREADRLQKKEDQKKGKRKYFFFK